MSSNVPANPPEHRGKMHNKPAMGVYRSKKDGYLEKRLREDDSDAVNMTDNKLGRGIRDFTKV